TAAMIVIVKKASTLVRKVIEALPPQLGRRRARHHQASNLPSAALSNCARAIPNHNFQIRVQAEPLETHQWARVRQRRSDREYPEEPMLRRAHSREEQARTRDPENRCDTVPISYRQENFCRQLLVLKFGSLSLFPSDSRPRVRQCRALPHRQNHRPAQVAR